MPELCTDLGKWKSSAKLFENIFDDTVHPNSPIILEKTSSSSVSILASITSPDSIRKQSQKNAKIKLHWPKRFLCVELDKKSPVAAASLASSGWNEVIGNKKGLFLDYNASGRLLTAAAVLIKKWGRRGQKNIECAGIWGRKLRPWSGVVRPPKTICTWPQYWGQWSITY